MTWLALLQFEGEHKESLYWGTYRPHVYLGIRARYNVSVSEAQFMCFYFGIVICLRCVFLFID